MSAYGALLALAFLAAIYLALARRHDLDEEALRDLCFWLIPISIAGARLGYVVTHSTPRWWAMWEGGLVFYGGVLAALIFTVIFCHTRKLPFGRVADLLAPSLALGHAIGRVGCHFAGCCAGIPLYEAGGELLLFAILVRRPLDDGRLAAAWIFFYSVMRFSLEPLRTDGFHSRPVALACALGALIWFLAPRRAR